MLKTCKQVINVVGRIGKAPSDNEAQQWSLAIIMNTKFGGNTKQTRSPSTGQVDMDRILSRLGGDRDLLVELVAIYSEDYPTLLERIERAVRERNGKKLHASGHALKGLVSNFMHERTTGLALKLEKMGASEEWDEIDIAVQDMKEAAEHLLQLITAEIGEQ